MAGAMTFRPRDVALPGLLEALAGHWLTVLAHRGYADNTVQAYRRDLERFVGYLAGRDIRYAQTVTPLHVEQFMDALLQGEQLSPRSVSRVLGALRSFFAWLQTQGLVTANNNPLQHAFALRFSPNRTTAPAMDRLLAWVDAIPADSVQGKRDRALFRLMLDGALRVSSLCGLDLYDAEQPPRHAVHPNGVVLYAAKGGRTEETVVGDGTLQALADWLAVRERFTWRTRPTPALFLSNRGHRMTRHTIHARLKALGKAGGMPQLHSHLLRHARVSDALERGDLHTASYLAGHANKATTAAIYGDQSRERLRHRIRRDCGLDGEAAA